MENNKDNEASNSPACAACRHQRKKCKAKECVLWPHFPSDRMEEFLAVQRVFGIANVTKMMRELDNDERAAAAASLLWEAKGWTEDPVHGPLRKFNRLQQELNALKASVFQYQPAMDAAPSTSLVPMGDNNILPQVKESLVISNNGGFPDPYPANFGQRWSGSVTPPYNQPQEIIASLQLPQQQPPKNSPVPGLIREGEYVGTMHSAPPNNLPVRDIDNYVRTIFSSGGEENAVSIFSTSPSLPIRGDNFGTSFNRLSRWNLRGEENGGTIFSTSPPLRIRGEDNVGTSFNSLSCSNVRAEGNGGTIFSTSPPLPIRGKDRVGTSFNTLSRWNVRGEESWNVREENDGTIFSTSPSLKGEDNFGTSFNHLSCSNVRGEEDDGTIFSTSPSLLIREEDSVLSRSNIRGEENGGTISSTSPKFPIRGKDNTRTSYNRFSGWNVRGDQDNVRTQFTSSINLPVKRDSDPAELCQQHSRNSNPQDDVQVSKQHKK